MAFLTEALGQALNQAGLNGPAPAAQPSPYAVQPGSTQGATAAPQTDLQKILSQNRPAGQPTYFGPGAFAAYARFQNLQNQQPPVVNAPPQVAPPTIEVQPTQDTAMPKLPDMSLGWQNASRALLESSPNRAAMSAIVRSFL